MSALDAVLLGNMTPSSDPAALLEVIAGIPSARPAALYTLSSVLTSLHLESTAASNGAKDGGGERGAKRQRTGDGGGAAEEYQLNPDDNCDKLCRPRRNGGEGGTGGTGGTPSRVEDGEDPDVGEDVGEEDDEEDGEAAAVDEEETAVVTTTKTTAKPTTTTRFRCDLNNPDADCECPKNCIACQSFKGAVAGDRLQCTECLPFATGGFVLGAGACLTKVSCKASKIVVPPKFGGEKCRCNDRNCNYCDQSSEGEVCKICRNGFYLHGDKCVAECPANLASMGSGEFKRRCAEPFECVKGNLFEFNTGSSRGVPYACKCATADNRFEPSCTNCNFNAGSFGQQCTRCN
eukprot:gene24713-32775_t